MVQELVDKRGPRSRTLLLDDGVTHRLEIGGDIAHHIKDGAYIPTNRNWVDLADRYSSGEHPYDIRFVKARRTLTIDWRDGTTTSIAPYGGRNPSSVTHSGSTVTFVRLWTGITLIATLAPEGINLAYTRTAATIVNPAWTVTGAWPLVGDEGYFDTNGLFVPVPGTLNAGRYTIDMSAVPVGVTIR